ncbi:hypothetical protein R3W88_012247 [Solanum pinnatisectum]|uniref:Uncharacterized protein n=1 Tax=Solanum pinnatisectum TaxID=50273 RepID=A0AAV9LBB6_9SOLN|nr:hypothetical protein R3W88_012247 [Solanum pinnatisectum]
MPYFLVYGNEAVLPAEVEIPSLRIIQEAELSDAKWIQVRSENLALIDGRKINTVCHGQLYQNRMARAFNKKVRPRYFSPGQLVLKQIFPNQDEPKGKFSPNWQGPYIVSWVLTGGALILAEMDGEIRRYFYKLIFSKAFSKTLPLSFYKANGRKGLDSKPKGAPVGTDQLPHF